MAVKEKKGVEKNNAGCSGRELRRKGGNRLNSTKQAKTPINPNGGTKGADYTPKTTFCGEKTIQNTISMGC